MGDGGLLETDKGDTISDEEGPEEDICFTFQENVGGGGVGGNYGGKVLSGVGGSGKGMGQ
jgi:hypothetical protein